MIAVLVAFVAEPTDKVDCATYSGAEAPAVITYPVVPNDKNVVVSAAVLYGSAPAVPPVMLVDFVAVAALPEMAIAHVPVAFVPDVLGAPTSLYDSTTVPV